MLTDPSFIDCFTKDVHRITSSKFPRGFVAVSSSMLAAGLLLSGCSNGGSADSSGAKPGPAEASEDSAVYQFENLRVADPDDALPFVSSNSPVTIELSDELKQAVPEGRSLAVERFEVTSKAFDTGYCRVDVQVSYASGDVEPLRASESSRRKARAADARAKLEKLLKTSTYKGSLDSFKQKLKDGSLQKGLEAQSFKSNDFEEQFYAAAGLSVGQDEYKEPTVPDVLPVSVNESAAIVDALPGDDGLEQGKDYVTSDGANVTRVEECSTSRSDSLVKVDFPYLEKRDSFADADVAVVKGADGAPDGTTQTVAGEVEAEVGVTGQWVAKD